MPSRNKRLRRVIKWILVRFAHVISGWRRVICSGFALTSFSSHSVVIRWSFSSHSVVFSLKISYSTSKPATSNPFIFSFLVRSSYEIVKEDYFCLILHPLASSLHLFIASSTSPLLCALCSLLCASQYSVRFIKSGRSFLKFGVVITYLKRNFT